MKSILRDMKSLLPAALLVLSLAPVTASAYGWSAGTDNFYHCYPTDSYGQTPRGTQPVASQFCRRYARWHAATDGYYHCYPTGDNGVAPVGLYGYSTVARCQMHFAWKQGTDGALHCYPTDSFGFAPGGTAPVEVNKCTGESAPPMHLHRRHRRPYRGTH